MQLIYTWFSRIPAFSLKNVASVAMVTTAVFLLVVLLSLYFFSTAQIVIMAVCIISQLHKKTTVKNPIN
jgi:hypothetical protein